MKYFLHRTLAYLIDCLIAFSAVMLVIQWAILSHSRSLLGITDEWFTSSVNMQLYVFTTISIPVWAYFSYFDSNRSKGTFGKRIFRLSVTDDEQIQIPIGKSIVRTVIKLLPWEIAHIGVIFPTPLYFQDEPKISTLSYLGILLFIIYVVSIIINSGKQSVYDKVLGTFVSRNS